MWHKNLNHKRVDTYKVTFNPRYNNFIIGQDYIFEETLKFIYEEDGKKIEKYIPLKYIGPYLQKKMFWHVDEQTLKYEFRGAAYSVKAEIIFNY